MKLKALNNTEKDIEQTQKKKGIANSIIFFSCFWLLFNIFHHLSMLFKPFIYIFKLLIKN